MDDVRGMGYIRMVGLLTKLKDWESARTSKAFDNQGKSLAKWDHEVEAVPGLPGFFLSVLWVEKIAVEIAEGDSNTSELGTSLARGLLCEEDVLKPEPAVGALKV